ncbi:hypothetical protein P7K49_020152 [Saguinus oedipus]|uniref:Uncharacterized protein n=1 Tax=Saguinus oedipus TaxID=9490 RepID=A0ABQ9UZJ9_SAGOE|nr:hypothetical protein P7K49_020152 [Saguinus oedipus]
MGLILPSIDKRHNLQLDPCNKNHLGNLNSLSPEFSSSSYMESNKLSSLAFDYRRQSITAQYLQFVAVEEISAKSEFGLVGAIGNGLTDVYSALLIRTS